MPFAAHAVFAHQGQICVAGSRLFVQSGIYDKFVEAAVKYAQSLKIGDPSDPTTQHGPQVNYDYSLFVLNICHVFETILKICQKACNENIDVSNNLWKVT